VGLTYPKLPFFKTPACSGHNRCDDSRPQIFLTAFDGTYVAYCCSRMHLSCMYACVYIYSATAKPKTKRTNHIFACSFPRREDFCKRDNDEFQQNIFSPPNGWPRRGLCIHICTSHTHETRNKKKNSCTKILFPSHKSPSPQKNHHHRRVPSLPFPLFDMSAHFKKRKKPSHACACAQNRPILSITMCFF